MLRTIGVLILLRCFDQVISSLPEVDSLSHLEPVAKLNGITSQGLKLDSEPPLLASRQPGTVLSVESKQKLQDRDCYASCVKQSSSTIQASEEAPSKPVAPVESRPIEGRAIGQSGDFQMGSNYASDALQTASSSLHQPPGSQTGGPRRSSYSDLTLAVLEPVFKPVMIPLTFYAHGLLLEHFQERIIEPYYPINMRQLPQKASQKNVNEVTEAIPKSQENCFNIGNNENTSTVRKNSLTRVCQLYARPVTGEKAEKSTLRDSELGGFTTHNVGGQSSENNSKLQSLKKERLNENLKEEQSNRSEFKHNILYNKLNLNIAHEESQTPHSAPISAIETKLKNKVKTSLPLEANWKNTLLKKEVLPKDKINESLHQNKFVKNDEKCFKTQQTAGNFNSVDPTVVTEKGNTARLPSQLNQRQPMVIQSKKKSVEINHEAWTVVKTRKSKKDVHVNEKSSKAQGAGQSKRDELAVASQSELYTSKMLSQSEFDQIKIHAQSKLQGRKFLSCAEGQSSFFKENNNSGVFESPVSSFHSPNLEKKGKKDTSDLKHIANAQASSEISSQEEKHTVNSDSIWSTFEVEFEPLVSDLSQGKTGSKSSTELKPITLKKVPRKPKFKKKKKVSQENVELENGTDPSKDKINPDSRKHQLTPELFKLQSGTSSSPRRDYSRSDNDKLLVNGHQKVSVPLPEPQYIFNYKENNVLNGSGSTRAELTR
ncbi:hypothetical protein O181_044951 [Austropuccinia psidii MF-1]|uniref:Uncharacterized protein n=1 Tax=Austropuccinia psidii MF-1 TaxID=1389203 RepID=A0A9Q3DRD9_9BASI|nr:hypothetical protein [Austropuccinia psidii MF-1]